MNGGIKMFEKIIAVFMAIAAFFSGIGETMGIPQPLSYDINGVESVGSHLEVVSTDEDTVTVKKTDDGEFKVMMFTDIHLDGKNETSETTVANIVDSVQREKPDLVLFGGDTVTSSLTKKREKQFAELFENLGVYWAGVLGNHEGTAFASLSRKKTVKLYSEYEHCLMLSGPDDVWGNGNYCINVLNSDGTLKKTFYFLDSGSEASKADMEKYGKADDGRSEYDGVKDTQVKWYADKVKENAEKYGESKSVLMLHIPIYQMRGAAETETFLYGVKLEGVCSSCFDSGLFDAMKELSSTDYVFFGHDHVNTFAINLDGITLSYIEPSGYGSYNTESNFGYEEKDWLQGYTKLMIKDDGTFTHEQIRYSAM